MAAPLEYKTPQNTETPVVYGEVGAFHYRYAYSRSADSLKNNENGQDFLSILTDGSRFVFALCDGVSQSFYGDLAARLLGGQLVEFFKKAQISEGAEVVKVELLNTLNRLTDTATRQVQDYALPAGLAPMLVGVLEKKKQMGSESTFVAGVMDAKSGLACFAWMGDSRLRLWSNGVEVTSQLGDNFHTNERWSTKKGAVGDVHVMILPASAFNHLAAYSDGFSYLDGAFTQEVASRPWAHQIINQFMLDASRKPSSDDISFLEVWGIKPSIPDGSDILPPPQVGDQTIKTSAEYLEMSWRPVLGASEYEVEVASDAGVLFSQKVTGTSWQTDRFIQQARKISIRAWKGSTPGLWSEPLSLPERELDILQPVTPIYESDETEKFRQDEFGAATTPTPIRSGSQAPSPHGVKKKREYIFPWLFDWKKISLGLLGVIVFFSFVGFGMKYLGKNTQSDKLHNPKATATKTISGFLPPTLPPTLTITPTIADMSTSVAEQPVEIEEKNTEAIVKVAQLIEFPYAHSKILTPPSIGQEVIILYKHEVEIPKEIYFYVKWGENKGWMRESWLELSGIESIPTAHPELIEPPVPTPTPDE